MKKIALSAVQRAFYYFSFKTNIVVCCETQPEINSAFMNVIFDFYLFVHIPVKMNGTIRTIVKCFHKPHTHTHALYINT